VGTASLLSALRKQHSLSEYSN